MDIPAFYREIQGQSSSVQESIFNEAESLVKLTQLHNFMLDYENLKSVIANRPESDVVSAAIKEYQLALFSLTVGQYRHAFGGLRLFFELMTSTIQFSAHEIDLRLWSKGEKDINWSALINAETGVFSVNFIKAFNPELSENTKQFRAIAEKIYRECSEFVHGNAITHKSLPERIIFNREIFLSWHQKAESIRVVIAFIFAARYLTHIDPAAAKVVEPTFIDIIGHLPAIQAIFSEPPKGE